MTYHGQQVYKIGTVELLKADIEKYLAEGKKYLVSYSRIFEIRHSKNLDGGYYGHCVYIAFNKCGMTKRGHFFAYTAAQVNNLLGYKLLNE